MNWKKAILASAAFLPLVIADFLGAIVLQEKDAEKTKERLNDEAAEFWIYDDLKAAKAEARKSRKPILLSFR